MLPSSVLTYDWRLQVADRKRLTYEIAYAYTKAVDKLFRVHEDIREQYEGAI